MMVPLGDIAVLSAGFPFRKKVQPEEGGDLALVQMKDINDAGGVPAISNIMLRSDARNYDRYLLKSGDLLFQSRGSRPPVAIVGEGLRGIAAAGLHVVRPNTTKVIPEYLAWWLNHPQSQARLSQNIAHGTYVPFVSKSDLASFRVPVPPLETQRQIAGVYQLQRRAEALSIQLNSLTKQLTDAATLSAATKNS